MLTVKLYIKFFAGTGVLLVLLWLFPTSALAQDNGSAGTMGIDRFYNMPKEHNVRRLLNRFALGVSSGYGNTFYSHKFDNVAVIQRDTLPPIVFSTNANYSNDTINSVYTGWFNEVVLASRFPVDTADYIASADSVDIAFRSVSRGIPITLTLHYNFLRNYRIGVGMSWEFHKIKPFEPRNNSNLKSFEPSIKKETFKRYFIYLGGVVWKYYEYSLAVDGQLGMYNLGGAFAKPKGFHFNLGVSLEREFSEYLTAFVRPSFEYRRFDTSLPEASLTVNHKVPVVFINVGTYLRLPELPRCRIKNCATQINHTHGGGKEWRSRMHPFYKKQNPHYGENYPKLFKYKWRNKNKINPY